MVFLAHVDKLSKTYIGQLAARPDQLELAAVTAAVDDLDFDEAAARLLARGVLGQVIPARLVARVYPRVVAWMATTTLVLVADGAIDDQLVAMVERDEFPADDHGHAARALALYTAWQIGDASTRARIVDETRSAAWFHRVSPLPRQAGCILQLLAAETGDAPLQEAAREIAPVAPAGYVPPEVAWVSAMLRLPGPERIRLTVHGMDVTAPLAQRVAKAVTEQIGSAHSRNAACWCGSGKKFKRCHGADETAVVPAALAPALRGASTLRSVDIQTMPLPELGALVKSRVGKLTDAALVAALDRLLKYRAWEHIDRVSAEYERRVHIPVEQRDQNRLTLFERALIGRHFDRARRYIAAFQSPPYRQHLPVCELSLALRQGSPDAFAELVRAADLAVRDQTGQLMMNLIPTILDVAPALGLLLVRGCLRVEYREASESVLRLAEHARGRLKLAGSDPTWDAYASLRTLAETRAESAALARQAEAIGLDRDQLRRTLDAAVAETRRLTERVRDLEGDLAQARALVVPESAEQIQARALRERVDELQDLLRERNAERADLRRRVAMLESGAAAAEPGTEPRAVAEPDTEAFEVDARIRLPAWQRRAADRLHDVPIHVAREALRTAAELATGEPAAWRGVKRLKGMSRPLLSARVGIHHRLLFELDDEALQLVDLVSRESLLVALKHLNQA